MYRFPASRREWIFDLYSVGRNGADEVGGGDDITGGPEVEFEDYSYLFRGGIVDVDWVRAHLDSLERDGKHKIIGAPPERLKEVEQAREAAPE